LGKPVLLSVLPESLPLEGESGSGSSLLITLSQKGAPFAAVEGRSMIVVAFALAAYSWVVCVLLKKFLLSSRTATMATLIVWFVVAFGVSAALFQLS
jgi:hypothetical protein